MNKHDFLVKKLLKENYSQYIESSSGLLKSKFVEKEITAMFIDIKAFTSITNMMIPKDLIEDLNNYFNFIFEIIDKNNGTVLNIIGDTVFAIFGEKNNNTHSDDACQTAIEIIHRLHDFNETRHNRPQINVGIGINTGIASLGFLGSDIHCQFTAISDSINLASRVEGLTGYYKRNILLTNYTKSNLKKFFSIEYVEKLVAKGNDDGVEIYAIKT